MWHKTFNSQKKISIWISIYVFSSSLFSISLASAAVGDLDTSFDTDGKVTTDFGASSDSASSIALQSDGKIVVAGYSYNGSNYDFAVVRYNTNGSLDTSFDTDGKVTTDFGAQSDYAKSVALQSDGKIVVAGYSYNGSNYDFAVVRYNTNGSLDTSFDTDGKVTTDFGASSDYAESVALQSDGKIVVAGTSYNGSNYDFAVVRYIASDSIALAAEAARVAAANAEAARKAKEQKELTEILAIIPKIGELTLGLGETTKSLYSNKCVKGKTTKFVKKGAKCPKGYVKKK
jgi:uncharacterized delta-60 repeat protein